MLRGASRRAPTVAFLMRNGTTGKYYWEILLGNITGKYYWEILLGNIIGKYYWEILLGKYACNICANSLTVAFGEGRGRGSSTVSIFFAKTGTSY